MSRPILAALGALACLAHASGPTEPGVFVLGIDGMDPVILQRLMDEGRMPHFQSLARDGSFQPLGTSNPPQSPVAWSTFVTGMDPGGHGIFDFVHRDPKTHHPISSATPPVDTDIPALRFFGYVIPLASTDVPNNRGGAPWWDILVDHGVDVEVYRMPGNFPTPPSRAKVLDGMGTVDLRGGYGTYTLYTDRAVAKDKPKGDIQLVSLQDLDLDGTPETARGILRGPPDAFHLEPGQVPNDSQYITLGVALHVDEAAVAIEVGDEVAVLAEGDWSSWIPVSFDALPHGLLPIAGTVRFFAKSLRPLEVYASPVNISPEDPAIAIASPDDFVDEVFRAMGFFYTKGMPEETDALKDGVFSDDDYVRQVGLVQEDSRAILELALDRFAPGDTTFVYLSDIDLQCHMLWRHGDPKHADAPPHPAYDATVGPAHAEDIERFYEATDAALGRVLERVPEGTVVIAMSDHGFQPYRRKVHLNSWLRDHGYLTLKDGKRTGSIALDDVDWSKTKAYGIGFNGLYLNLAGRENGGSVDPASAPALMKEIGDGLLALDDGGTKAVLRVDDTRAIYTGPRIAEGPDLVVGYNAGYGCSDESTLGEIVEPVLEDNASRWSGNHLMAPEVVPGVLLTNRKLPASSADLRDLTVTLLAHYGIAAPPTMTGRALF
jgi:predicted AlkP superfamily phosphohydrolase/phosphomutase